MPLRVVLRRTLPLRARVLARRPAAIARGRGAIRLRRLRALGAAKRI